MGYIVGGIVLIFFAVVWPIIKEYMNETLKNTWQTWGHIVDLHRESLPKNLVLGVIHQESRGRAEAKNPRTSALGLMQIMPAALKDFTKATGKLYTMGDMIDAHKNIEVGCYYLNWLTKNYGVDSKYGLNQVEILRAYNWGIGNVLKYVKAVKEHTEPITMPTEAWDYPHKILNFVQQLDYLSTAWTT